MDARVAAPDEVELPRARGYMLLASLLARPPSADFLERLGRLEGDASEWGAGLAALGAAARNVTEREAEREYSRLFIGLQRGELVPYASYYVTGFLHDRPLVAVRRDMARLGIARSPEVKEPEDHIAALLEMMAGLVDGRFGAPAPAERQRAFFDNHLLNWAPGFFRDLEAAEAARLYRPVARLGLMLLEIERQAFALE